MSMLISEYRGIAGAVAACSLALALSACGDDADRAQNPENAQAMERAEKDATLQAAEDGRIDCALGEAAEYRRQCNVERIADDGGQMLVIRHPDGGFRRFRVLTDGRGLEPAEGFDETQVKIVDGDMIEVTSGGDRYRLPAQIKTAPVEQPEPTADAAANQPAVAN